MSESKSEPRAHSGQLFGEFGGPRACGKYELAGVLDLGNLVMRALAAPPGTPTIWPTIGFDWAHVFNHANLDNIRLIADGGQIVSMVAIYPSVARTSGGDIRVGGINCFATHPHYRHRGLGGAVLQDAHAKMRADGYHIALLSTDVPNYYRRFGWENGGRELNFVFDRGNVSVLPDPAGYEVTEEWRSYVAELKSLHDMEPMAASRTQEIFNLLAERKFQRLFVAKRGGRVVAYVGLYGGLEPERGGGLGSVDGGQHGRHVPEYGGAPEDVAALLRAVFADIDDPEASTSDNSPGGHAYVELSVTTPDSTDGLPGLLSSRRVSSRRGYIGMILLLDPQGLLESLDIADVRVEPRDGGWRFRQGPRTLDLTEREAVKLIFGPEVYSDFAPDVFPVEFFQWPLDRV